MPIAGLPFLIIACAIPLAIWIVFMLGSLVVAALWDWMLVALAVLVLWKIARARGQATDSFAPAFLWLPIGLLSVALVAGWDWKPVRDMTGMRHAVPFYNLTGIAFGPLAADLREDFGNEIGRARRCEGVLTGTHPDAAKALDYCRYVFPDGVDGAKLTAVVEALDADDLLRAQSALETFQNQPYLNYHGVSPANWSSFEEWHAGDAGEHCPVARPAETGYRTSLVYCAGSRPDYVSAFCVEHGGKAEDYAMIRAMCGSRRTKPMAAAELAAYAAEEGRICGEGVCDNWVFPDERGKDADWFRWLEERAGWKRPGSGI